jgi:type IV pilus assembly protein PilM
LSRIAFSQFQQRVTRFFEPKLPPVSAEIAPDYLALVRVNLKNPRNVERQAVVPIPPGLVVPSLLQPNITSPPDFLSILKAALTKMEVRSNRISLAIPDASVKVAIHHLDKLPGNENERLQLLKWRLKKTIPFNVEDSQLAYLQQPAEAGGYLVLTVSVHREVLSQFEGLFQSLGMQAGYITPSSFAALELLSRLEGQGRNRSLLFLRAGPGGVTTLISQKHTIAFFRHAERGGAHFPSSSAFSSLDSAEELYGEIHPCLMYCQDKLGASSVDEVLVLCPQDLDKSRLNWLSEKTGCKVANLDPLPMLGHSPYTLQPALKNSLASALGLALRRL